MSAQLSKLHVRYIQTQKSFTQLKSKNAKEQKLPLSQLYIKDNSSFYLIQKESPIQEKTLSLLFKESTDALKTLQCDVTVSEVDKTSEAFEDALLFFNTDASQINQLLLLTIDTIKGK